MTTPAPYPFYKSLRFRFGLVFGLVFLCFLQAIVFLLYTNVKNRFEENFKASLTTKGNNVLQKTDLNPLTVPLPESNEYFLLVYNAKTRSDTLFNNLPLALKKASTKPSTNSFRSTELVRSLETGAEIRITYALPATELDNDISKLRIILFFYFPLSFIIALIAGYYLSGFLLRPIENIVSKANEISLQTEITLLKEPSIKDELYKLTKSLNGMLTRIQRQAKEQSAFFASASHELRTPLSVMLTELQILQTDDLPVKLKTLIANQLTEVQRLGKLVDDFLLVSQLEAGSIVLTQTKISLVECCLSAMERLASRARNNQQSFKIELDPENANFEIWTDQSQLTTILLNLIDNAVKHGTHNTRLQIAISQKQDSVSFKLRNHPKVRLEDLDVLTQEFKKHNSDGFGLGLWIVNRLTALIGAEFLVSYHESDFTVEVIFRKENFLIN